MKKEPKKDEPEDKTAIVLKSLIMILVSRGFICKVTGDTLMDFLKGSKDNRQ